MLANVKIDSHIHLWNAEHTPQPWMTDEHEPIARPFGPTDILPLLERNNIGAVIVVQGACLNTDTDYLFAEAHRCDWIAAVIAWVCLSRPERSSERLDILQGRPKFRGVRHLTQGEPDYWLLREPVLESVAMLEERGLIFEIPLVFRRPRATGRDRARSHHDGDGRDAIRLGSTALSELVELDPSGAAHGDLPRWRRTSPGVADLFAG